MWKRNPTAIRCPEHKGKRAKKGLTLAHFDDGLVRRG